MNPLQTRGITLEPSSYLTDRGMDVIHLNGAWRAKAGVAAAGTARRVRDAVKAKGYDLVLVHRESAAIGPAWVERILRPVGVPYAFDFDDAIYLPASSEANRRFTWLKQAGKTAAVVRNASLVIAGNAHLAEWARRQGGRAVVIPTAIDTDAYRPTTASGDPVCIGWTGSPSTIQHLELLAPTLAQLQRERGIRIRVIGDPSYQMAGAQAEVLRWSAASEIADLSGVDIGVMPLPDDEWARGKCGLKALQYMALGIPTVVSPVGVNREIARDGAAITAQTADEWALVLRTLIDDPELRARVGRHGRARVEQEYSVEATLPQWEQALRMAATLR